MSNSRQISVFLANRPGTLAALLKSVKECGVNMRALSIADTRDFGIVRMIVNDTEGALAHLRGAGYAVTVTDIVAVTVPDAPGQLSRVVGVLAERGVNIEYMYAFAARHGEEAILVFRFDDLAKAEEALTAAGRDVISPLELFSHK